MEKWPGMAPNGAKRICLLLIKTRPTFFAEWIRILRVVIFGIFSVHGKMAWDGPKWGREDFFPTNPDLPTFWAERI